MATGGDEHILYPNLPDPIVPLFKEAKTEKYSREMFKLLESRKANISRLKKQFMSDETRFGLGVVFHITPSNVPVLRFSLLLNKFVRYLFSSVPSTPETGRASKRI